MTKIEQGILINSQHQYNVLNNIPEEISFRDQILALGYNDIEEFFKEKAIYEMQTILKTHISSVSMNNLASVLFQAAQTNNYSIISIYTDETCVCHGENTEKRLNKQYCEEHNIPIYPYNSFGGNIIATKEDYGVAFFLPTSIDMSTQLVLENLVLILNKYFTNVNIDGNDILIDNKKVIGSGSFGDNNIICILVYFSMSDKQDLIYNICGEPTTNKMPGHINSNILTREQLITEVLGWLQGL